MKKIMKKLLFELLKDSKKSDRELAKVLGISQASVSRMRNRLVEEGLIREFTVIPDFVELGYELMAICSVRKKGVITETTEKVTKWLKKYPNIIFAARAEGMKKNGVIISLHKNYTEYSKFVAGNLQYWGDEVKDYDTMLISLRGIIPRQLSLRYLGEAEGALED